MVEGIVHYKRITLVHNYCMRWRLSIYSSKAKTMILNNRKERCEFKLENQPIVEHLRKPGTT